MFRQDRKLWAHVWFLKEVAESNLGKILQISCDNFSSLTKNISNRRSPLGFLPTQHQKLR